MQTARRWRALKMLKECYKAGFRSQNVSAAGVHNSVKDQDVFSLNAGLRKGDVDPRLLHTIHFMLGTTGPKLGYLYSST